MFQIALFWPQAPVKLSSAVPDANQLLLLQEANELLASSQLSRNLSAEKNLLQKESCFSPWLQMPPEHIYFIKKILTLLRTVEILNNFINFVSQSTRKQRSTAKGRNTTAGSYMTK